MHYFELLNLNEEPFSNSPDPDFFFGSRQHKSCLQKIEISLRLHRGLNLIIGEVGTGKTTLCRQLIRNLADDEQIETHLILDPQFNNPLEFLTAIAGMFGGVPPAEATDDLAVKEWIKKYIFRKGVDENKTILLIIDEGQKIPEFCLEILREFLNYETNKNKLLQIAIFAQEEFKQTLENFKNFTDRINLYVDLKPLNFRETRSMIQFRLSQSSRTAGLPALFSPLAFWTIYRTTGGYPRQIITLCHQLILAMIVKKRTRVGWRFVRACAAQLFDEDQTRSRRVPGLVALIGLAAIAIAGLILGQAHTPVALKPPVRPPAVARKIVLPPNSTARVRRIPPQAPEPVRETPEPALPAVVRQDPAVVEPPAPAASPEPNEPRPAEKSPRDSEAAADPEVTFQNTGLETIRAARHSDFFRIVFQFNEKVLHEAPEIYPGEAVIQLSGVTTDLKPMRKYKTFDSWVKLEQKGSTLNARIGLPDNFDRLKSTLMQNPPRLIVDLYFR